MKRFALTAGVLIATGIVLWWFPPFRIVSLDERQSAQQAAKFNAAEFVEDFWSTKLLPSLEHAPAAVDVLAAIRDDPQQARERFGRSVGLGGPALYVFRGRGTIVSVEKNTIGVSLADGVEATEGATRPDLLLKTGLIFGNTVRDATGLIKPSDFARSQQFNDISTELNRVVESRVISLLKEQAQIGRSIEFTGCAQVPNGRAAEMPLEVIPLEVKIEPQSAE